MLKPLSVIAGLALFAGNTGHAMTDVGQKAGNGYFFAAPGVETCCGGGRGIMQVGGGAEGTIYRGLGVNADAGYIFRLDRAGAGCLTLSAGPAYQFNRSRKTVPFVTGGLSLAVAAGAAGAFHFGGGVIRWFHPRWGLRVEARDHIAPPYWDSHFIVFRFGLALR